MKWYKEEFKGRNRISMKQSGSYLIPNSSSAEDAAAVQRGYDFNLGWFSGSWTDGNYPASMRETLGDLLPELSAENLSLIKGSQDFYAIDPYQTYVAAAPPGGIEACANNSSNPYWPSCYIASTEMADGFPTGPAADVHSSSWLWSNPSGIRGVLNDITKKLYPSVPDVVVSEFGFVEPGEGDRTLLNEVLWDLRRADYFQSYLDNILAARVVDGVNVTGAFAWAIYDNIEVSLPDSEA
jgi:WD repeat-containing protein 26